MRKKMHDIVFIIPPGGDQSWFNYQLGVAYIQAQLKEKGVSSSQYIPGSRSRLRDINHFIAASNPLVVGFTVYDSNFYITREIVRSVKEHFPGLVLAAGGPTATYSCETLLRDMPGLDFCVRGESEFKMHAILTAVHDKVPINEIPGISFREGQRVHYNENGDELIFRSAEEKYELDALPSPYLSGILDGSESAGIITSRGCNRFCTYCNFSTLARNYVRWHSLDRVIEELGAVSDYYNFQKKRNITREQHFCIYDDAITIDRHRAEEICLRIIKNNIKLPLWAECRADQLDRELLLLMKQAGFTKINIGLESAVPRILYEVQKVRKRKALADDYLPERRFVEQVARAVRWAAEIGISPTVSVVLGLPGESADDAERTIDFVDSLPIKSYAHNYLRIHPGTKIHQEAKNYGISFYSKYTPLPLITKYTYNVKRVRMAKKYIHNQTKGFILGKILKHYSGVFSKNEQGDAPDIKFMISSNNIEPCLPLLKEIVPLAGLMGVYYKTQQTGDNWESDLDTLWYEGIPANLIYCVIPLSDPVSPGKTYIESCKVVISTLSLTTESRFVSIPFSRIRDIEQKDFQSPDEFILFTLDTREDIQALIEFFEKNCKEGMYLEIPLSIPIRVYFSKACRWSSVPCHLCKPGRAALSDQKQLSICGEETTEINSGSCFDSLLSSRKESWQAEMDKRGCDSCEVAASCSKCFVPSPLSVEQYCSIRRQYPLLPRLFSLWNDSCEFQGYEQHGRKG
ncbi:MAG: B12-binding domain-containing radical SAM protein [Candidatus Aminicenantes bacterium]|nr:B12-binding domain-containing radical SAM protein [Candidatus Aminicenantes bacterium]